MRSLRVLRSVASRPASWASRTASRSASTTAAFSTLRDEAHACVVVDGDGGTASRRVSVARLRARTGAPLRDLLHLGLDDRGASLEHACVLPRARATLVQLGGVKAAIGEREALFFDAEASPAVAAAVARVAAAVQGERTQTQRGGGEERLPFELVVLEGVLGEVSAAYARRADLYARTVERALSRSYGGGASDTVEGLHRLGAFDGALVGFEGEVGDALRVLEELLASDEDMVGLLVGERRRAGGAPLDPERHAVVELVLESYHRRLRRVARTLRDLRAEVARARDVARVTIDLRRNHIIEFNLHLSMAAVGLAATTAVAGLFGMNLVSGVEDSSVGFAAVTCLSAALGVGVVAAFRDRLRRDATVEAQARAATDDRVALASLLEHMGTLEHLFDATARAADAPGGGEKAARTAKGGELGRDDLAALMETARGRAPSPREIDLLFDVFDVTGDGRISPPEARRALGHDPASKRAGEKEK